MTDFIEKITDNRRWTDNELENTVVSLNIDCPICGKHEVCVKSAVFQDPTVIQEDPRHCVVTIGCEPCAETMIWHTNPDLTMDNYKEWINKTLVYDWLDAVSKDDRIHAWKRDNLFNVVNGRPTQEFWEYQISPVLKSIRERHKETLDRLAEDD